MTIKYDKFVNALRKLCIEHGVILAIDGVGDLCIGDMRDPQDPLLNCVLQDETTPSKVSVPREGMVMCGTCNTLYQSKRFDYCPYCTGDAKE